MLPWYKGKGIEIFDIFTFQIPFPLFQGNTLSLTNAQYSVVNFLTARKMMSHPSVLAGQSD